LPFLLQKVFFRVWSCKNKVGLAQTAFVEFNKHFLKYPFLETGILISIFLVRASDSLGIAQVFIGGFLGEGYNDCQ
jgi:hypothetical protein